MTISNELWNRYWNDKNLVPNNLHILNVETWYTGVFQKR